MHSKPVIDHASIPHTAEIARIFDGLASERDKWIARNAFFYKDEQRYLQFLIPPGKRILEVGCGTGQLLAALRPAEGVGLDISPRMVEHARENFPHLKFVVGDVEDGATIETLGPAFDFILLPETIGLLTDCQTAFENLANVCHAETRLVIAQYSHLWEPVLKVAEKLRLKMPTPLDNWLSPTDIGNLLHLSGYEVVKTEWRQIVPRHLLGLGTLINRYLAPLPGVRQLCLRHYVVARSLRHATSDALPSVSIVVPCRNEKGNIEPAVERLPRFAPDMEVVFVEGHSSDGTYDECRRVQAAYPDWDIGVMRQEGEGKGDAIRIGFDRARGEVLMILDADLTVPPEDLPKFYQAILSGKGEFANGTRLVYPMEGEAMRFLNHFANRVFAGVFSWLLNQRFSDTLCGTKVVRKRHYEMIAANRHYFGEFDPFGDFDLLFGAAKLGLKIVEVPVRYRARTYGATQIRRFVHGWLLLRMVLFAFRKLKFL